MTLSGYLISIAAISIATVMIEAVMPEGSMAAFVRRIAALIVVFVIIAPVPNLIKKQQFNFGFETGGQGNLLNDDLLMIINNQRCKELENSICEALKKEGVMCDVAVYTDLTAKEFTISYISIKTMQSGVSNIESIKRVVKKYVILDDSKIVVT